MRKLQIEGFTADNKPLFKTVAEHVDATKNITIISQSSRINESEIIRLTTEIDHFNIFSGMITIYYRSGCFIEITKL